MVDQKTLVIVVVVVVVVAVVVCRGCCSFRCGRWLLHHQVIIHTYIRLWLVGVAVVMVAVDC